jgi:signal transduction histidine kinase/CheY-like chemotaxis protein
MWAYAIAIGATGAIALIRILVSDTVGNFVPLVPFLISVVMAAWCGGLKPGLVATALGAVAADYLFIPTQHTLRVESIAGAVALAMFVSIGVLISWAYESLHRARRLLESKQRNLRINMKAQRKLQTALVASDRRKDELLATVAHELRSPLVPLRIAAHILRTATLPQEAAEAQVGVIDRQVTQMTRLIDDLTDVARIARGMLALSRGRVDIAEMIQNAVEMSRPLIDSCGHELSVNLLTYPVYIDADKVRLTQLISNLLNNAAKYTPRGGRIHIENRVVAGELILSVTDTGIGIPKSMLERIFEPFVRLDHRSHRAKDGLGIGLALARQLARLHGGDITACSPGPGLGTEFSVRLPIATSQECSLPTVATVPNSAMTGSQPRILVVEGDRDSADALSLLLTQKGCVTRIADDGTETMGAATEFRPDMVLLDIDAPKFDGWEVATRIRAQAWGEEVLLVAMSGWDDAEHKQRVTEAGFDHHFVKPVDPGAMLQVVEALRSDVSDHPTVAAWSMSKPDVECQPFSR